MKTMLFATPDDLSTAEIGAFWDQGMNMDDWDYMVLFDNPDDLLEVNDEETPNEDGQLPFRCVDWTIDRLLGSFGDGQWYRGTYKGKLYAVGVVYHA